jgi:glucan phosphoethanolaminetransferase (alkaline phosphatase superfamily)
MLVLYTLYCYCLHCTTASAEDSMQALIEAEAAATAAVSAAQERTAAVAQQLQQSQAAAAALTAELAAAQEELLIARTLVRVQSRSSLDAGGHEGSTLCVLLCIAVTECIRACVQCRPAACTLLMQSALSFYSSSAWQGFIRTKCVQHCMKTTTIDRAAATTFNCVTACYACYYLLVM